ncbi:MAG: HTH-type transcriptional regulator IscR [Pseudomonadota bacterium]|jgi:Rrf2 family iron-sulfur cluster assembly transcriptional regulator
MRLSTKSRFAVTAMIDVALREDHGPVALAAISARHQISLSYLEQLFSKLRQAELVESTRGPGGGYSLARNAEKITMADIVAAVDAPEQEEGIESSTWMRHELWAGLNEKMLAHLQSISLRQLVAEQRNKGVKVEAPAQTSSTRRGVFARPKTLQAVKVNAPNSVFALAGSLLTSHS